MKDYKNLDVNLGFERTPWHVAEVFDDIGDNAWTWEYLYWSIINDHLKRKKLKVREKSLPWINTAIRNQINLRYKLSKKAQKSPNDTDKWTRYKKQRNHVTRIFRQTEADYWKHKFENANSSGEFWKIVRETKGQKKANIGPIRGEEGVILTNNNEKAESLNQFC
eukprot:gene13179-3980_t